MTQDFDVAQPRTPKFSRTLLITSFSNSMANVNAIKINDCGLSIITN